MNKRLLAELNGLFALHASVRVNGKTASDRTQEVTREVMMASFRCLADDLGFHMENPANLGERHLKALVHHWHHVDKNNAKTLQNKLSRLRVVYRDWLKKPGLVKSASYYLPDVPPEKLKVKTAAEASKAWSSHGIDIAEKIKLADKIDPRFGLMLRFANAFGARRKEVLHFQPHIADRGDCIRLIETKGGRPRDIRVDTKEQRETLDFIKSKVKKGEALNWPITVRGKVGSVKYGLKHYLYRMKQIGVTKLTAGVTGHGLRAGYVEDASIKHGFLPPVLEGKTARMGADDFKIRRTQIAEDLGHNRPGIYCSYCGQVGRYMEDANPRDDADLLDAALLVIMHRSQLEAIKSCYMDDAMTVVRHLAENGYQMSPACAYTLWRVYSRMRAVEWVQPEKEIVIALLAAAVLVVRSYNPTNCIAATSMSNGPELDRLTRRLIKANSQAKVEAGSNG